MRTFYCVVILLLLGAPAAGREIFVDNRAGDDQATGQQLRRTPDRAGPVRTIARALQLAHNGDSIILMKNDVPYRESISLVGSHCSGVPAQPFLMRGNGAILDGSRPVPPDAWKPYGDAIFRFRPQQMAYQQLFLDGRPAERVAVPASAHRPPKLEPRQWCLLDGQICFCVEKTKLPGDYKLSYAHDQTGITLFHVDHVIIADLTVQGFQLDGINLFNSAQFVSLVGVTCRGNGRSGVAVGGASLVDVAASLLGDNGYAQLLTLPYSETHLHDTYLLSNTAPGWVDQGGRVYRGEKRIEGGLRDCARPPCRSTGHDA